MAHAVAVAVVAITLGNDTVAAHFGEPAGEVVVVVLSHGLALHALRLPHDPAQVVAPGHGDPLICPSMLTSKAVSTPLFETIST